MRQTVNVERNSFPLAYIIRLPDERQMIRRPLPPQHKAPLCGKNSDFDFGSEVRKAASHRMMLGEGAASNGCWTWPTILAARLIRSACGLTGSSP